MAQMIRKKPYSQGSSYDQTGGSSSDPTGQYAQVVAQKTVPFKDSAAPTPWWGGEQAPDTSGTTDWSNFDWSKIPTPGKDGWSPGQFPTDDKGVPTPPGSPSGQLEAPGGGTDRKWGPGSSGGYSGGDPLAWIQSMFASLPPTTESLQKLVDALKNAGVNIEWATNASGQSPDKVIINGKMYDLIYDVDGPGSKWQLMEVGAGGGGAAGGGMGPGGAGGWGGPINYGPMITPNGMVPPGMPYQPTSNQQMQDKVLQGMLTTPAFSQDFINRQNEAQKELILQRGKESANTAGIDAARRGAIGGGTYEAQKRRINDTITSQLLQSQRDIAMQGEAANREGFLKALAASEGVWGPREDRSRLMQQFLESIRQYNQNFGQHQYEYLTDNDYRYALANLQAQMQYINQVMGGGI